MITPRATRLLRVAGLRQLRNTLAAVVSEGDPLAARDRLVVVPTRAAAAYLRRALEDRLLPAREAVVLPEIVTRDDLTPRLAGRIPDRPRVLGAFEREVLLAAACHRVADAGVIPPFRLRPGLVGEILDFYDALRRHQNSIGGFERLMLDTLEPNASIDRGAERLARQTRFLAAAFREFERRCGETGALDEHSLRDTVRSVVAARPWTQIVVAVRDLAASPYGLWACDFDLMTRVPGLERLDLIVTEAALAGGLHERLRDLLPGIEEVPVPDEGADAGGRPRVLRCPKGLIHTVRDREEEVVSFARRVKQFQQLESPPALDRVALVVRRPLPYVYLAREVLRSAAVPCQMFDTLPLAGESYAAALDLVFSFVTSHASRAAIVALMRSPYFDVAQSPAAAPDSTTTPAHHRGSMLSRRDVVALDRALSEASYLGGEAALETLVASWRTHPKWKRAAGAGAVAVRLARELSALGSPQPAAAHLTALRAFLDRYARPLMPSDPLAARLLRARAAVLSGLTALSDAYARHDDRPADFSDLTTIIRGWIEDQTFSPRAGATGVHVADAESAAFGDFDDVQLAGLVDGEWPQRPRRSIFYSSGLLKQLGWPAESDRLQGERSLFRDLLQLPSRRLTVSAFLLEDDAIVSASPFGDEVEGAGLDPIDAAVTPTRVLDVEALTLDPPRVDALPAGAAAWARLRFDVTERRIRQPGVTSARAASAYSLSALERYQDCPFKFFASEVLQLEEPAEGQSTLTPRTRGRFIHEVFQRFFEDWDSQEGGRAGGPITPESFDAARARFAEVAERLLARLPDAEASLERTRLFGSPAAVGIADIVLGLEASRPEPVVERWLEYRLDGEFTLGAADGRRAPLRGVVDRVDLLAGRRLRVIDYKSGAPPNVKRALQAPVYAMCASERLEERDGQPWSVDEAAYISLSGKRALVPVVRPGAADAAAVLDAARDRVFEALDGIARGEFPPRPYETRICGWCAFASVCRKDYVGDE